jgi:CheY-like chemotaxis protein
LVDDDLEALRIFERMLVEHGYQVRTASTAESALTEMEANPPTTVVTDLRLPTIDGVELLQHMRQMPGLDRTPVTVITADYLLDETVIAQIEALGGRLCFKPIWEEDLLRIVGGTTDVTSSSVVIRCVPRPDRGRA